MENVDENLTCRVCLGVFDDGTHRPLLLPACGHTFCSFCIKNLHKKGKLNCPECRKDSAVRAVSSLPVNYSLLNVVQSKVIRNTASVTKTQDEATGLSKSPDLSPEWNVNFSSFPPIGRAERSTSSANSSRPPKPLLRSHPSISHINSSQRKKPVTPVSSLDPQHDFNDVRRSELFTGENSREAASPARLAKEKKSLMSLQEELDFQMAVHLTFCKDASHGHDAPRHTSRCWQFPVDDDLHTALALSRTYKD